MPFIYLSKEKIKSFALIKNRKKNSLENCPYVQAEFRERIVAVLANNALGSLQVVFLCWWCPPFGQIAIGAELTSLVKLNFDNK